MSATLTHGQDLPRPSISRIKDGSPSFERPYNLKIGPIAFTASAALSVEYVDNINLTPEKKEADLLIQPTISLTGVWQVSKLNSLELRGSFGYNQFLNNPDLNSQVGNISPDSMIRLNLFVGDVKFVFREQFALQEDTVGQPGAAGLATFARFTNNAGITALWDMNDVLWTVAVDRFDLITTGNTRNTAGQLDNFSLLDRNTHQLSTSLMFRLAPTTSLGLEGTYGYTAFPKNPDADSSFWSIGPVLEMQLTRYTQLSLGAGWQAFGSESEGAGTVNRNDLFAPGTGLGATGIQGGGFAVTGPRQTGEGNSYYFNLSITHRLNRFYTDSLSVFRETQTGLFGDRTESFGFSYNSQWTLTRRIVLATSIFYANIHDTAQENENLVGQPDFLRYGVTISTGFQLTRKLNASLRYQFTKETSDLDSRSFAQNRVGLSFGYQF